MRNLWPPTPMIVSSGEMGIDIPAQKTDPLRVNEQSHIMPVTGRCSGRGINAAQTGGQGVTASRQITNPQPTFYFVLAYKFSVGCFRL